MKVLKILALTLVGPLILLFAAVGVLYFTRATPAQVVHAFGETAGPPAPGATEFGSTLELFTGTPLLPGHRVELLTNGDETFPRLWRDLRSARRSLTVQMYYAAPGIVADSLKVALIDRASAGVTTHFLYDGFGAGPLRSEYLDSLRAAGVRVASFRPVKWYTLHKAQNRSHVRAVVVDGRLGYTGGFGIDDKWLGDGRTKGQWRETNVRFAGPAVRQLQAAFAVAWTEATGELLVGDLYFPRPDTAAAGDAAAGLLFAAPTLGSTQAERLLALTFAGVRQRLYITNAYVIPSPSHRQMLIRAASQGVDVRILVPDENSDVPIARYAGQAYYEELLRRGVRIFEYQETMMHAKTFVADGQWSMIGSMNLDNRSIVLNDESNLLVLDETVGARMDSLFMADLERAEEVLLARFTARSWWARLRERGASLVATMM